MQRPQAEQQQQAEAPQPAPSSDAVLAAAPPYVVGGTWDDEEWREVAAKPQAQRTEAETYVFLGGPRPHPWGRAAHMAQLPNGQQAAFPSKQAYEAFAADEDGKARAAQGTLDTLAASLAGGSAPVPPAHDPDQADHMLQGAAPDGTIGR